MTANGAVPIDCVATFRDLKVIGDVLGAPVPGCVTGWAKQFGMAGYGNPESDAGEAAALTEAAMSLTTRGVLDVGGGAPSVAPGVAPLFTSVYSAGWVLAGVVGSVAPGQVSFEVRGDANGAVHIEPNGVGGAILRFQPDTAAALDGLLDHLVTELVGEDSASPSSPNASSLEDLLAGLDESDLVITLAAGERMSGRSVTLIRSAGHLYVAAGTTAEPASADSGAPSALAEIVETSRQLGGTPGQ